MSSVFLNGVYTFGINSLSSVSNLILGGTNTSNIQVLSPLIGNENNIITIQSKIYGPTSIIPIGGIIMYSGYWPPKDINSNTTNNLYITNFTNNNCWILCDGGESTTINSLPTNTNISYELINSIPKSINMYSMPISSNISPFNFSIPDLRGRFVMGCCKNDPNDTTSTFDYTSTIQGTVDNSQKINILASSNQSLNQISNYSTYPGELNKYGGVMSQTITISEMPSHRHSYADSTTQGSNADGNSAARGVDVIADAQRNTGFEGGNAYRSKLPPYWVLSYIMRIG
jgi:microcystin-dependent protein